MEQAIKNFLLFMSKNRLLNRTAKKYGLLLGAKRFVAGETIEEAVQVIKQLNTRGITVTLDNLGEFVFSEKEAVSRAEECVKALEAMDRGKVDATLSVKLTSLGLDVSYDLCRQNMVKILETARKYHNSVNIDMEDYGHLEDTLRLYEDLREQGYGNVEIVLQGYLRRSASDLEKLDKWGTVLRLVKGAYKETADVAFTEKSQINENFKKLIAMQLQTGNYVGVATHDEEAVRYTKEYVKEHNIALDKFEFQMLYGICTDMQLQLIQEGYRVRVYLPYGRDWYGYLMRRLAERPSNVLLVIKGMFK